ncbi:hypothetical protein ACIGEZ_33220 [Streptomyces sp. NPDC085481]|uniref:hypothetical protein n=1 Tax=Streptomyces sp. NPDC085481 TaxID=3365727 RepID=UPI0037CFFAC2
MERAKRYGSRYGAAVVLAAVVSVTGCSGAPAQTGDKPGLSVPPVPTGPATPTATATAGRDEPAPQEVLVEVVVNGGFAGVRNKLVVHYDGSYTTRSGTKPPKDGRMTATEVAALRAALEDPAYAKVPDRPSGPPVADGFQYFITYHHRLVVAGDGERPPALQRVFSALPEGGPPTSP